MTWGGGAIVVFAALIVGAVSLQPSVARQSIAFSTVDVGVLEISINAGGTVAPAYEEIINSPIDSRIVEVYKKVGDSVQAGQPSALCAMDRPCGCGIPAGDFPGSSAIMREMR